MSAVAAALLLVVALGLTRPFGEAPWHEAPPNPASIYLDSELGATADPGIPIVSPFHLRTEPMAGLLLINFDDDPDETYVGFEPQAFDDTVHGRGLLVIGWRADGRIDVFHDAGLRLDPDSYRIAGKGLHVLVERSLVDAVFELGHGGVRADIAFHDLEGRLVHLVVRETDDRPRSRFGLLAPMGMDTHDPPALPLVYVDGFYFVRRAGTEYRIEIDGRLHRSDPIPLILDGARVHSIRYSTEPFVVTWNPDEQAALRMLDVELEPDTGALLAHAGGVRYDVEANGPFREIRRMSRREGDHEVIVEFSPAVPQLLALVDGIRVTGRFRITAQPSLGTVQGSWRVRRRGGELQLEITPDGGWTPGPAPRLVRLLFRVVPMFREWPTTYAWQGTIQLPAPGKSVEEASLVRSGWERIAPH